MEVVFMVSNEAKKKILIIDDEPSVVAYLETLFQDNGYETVSAMDGQTGLGMLKSEHPDLVTLDIAMPETSGIRLYRNLKDDVKLAKIPVVIVTAVTGEAGDPEPFKKFISTRKQVPPPEGFISKPIEREVLLARVNELLGCR
jgi:CheY-like chemotaxis protein